MTRPLLVALALLFLGAQLPAQAVTPLAAPDSLLDRLVGSWHMTGRVRGKPVQYRMQATRAIAGRYVELHMIDTARTPEYEARVFIGADKEAPRILVHWLDSSGAAGSVPHGIGTIRGDTLQFEFAYGGGPFRDTFVYRGKNRGWHFLLESGDGKGAWRLFAEYDVTAVAPTH